MRIKYLFLIYQILEGFIMSEKRDPYPLINALECKACERCVIGCKKGVLKMSDDINERGYHYVVYEGEECTGCGDCYYTCPEPLAIEVHIPRKEKKEDD